MSKIKVIENNEGYEALYIDDWIKDEGNPLNEGDERVLYFLRLCSQYGVDIELIRFGYVDSDEEFPSRMSELSNIKWRH